MSFLNGLRPKSKFLAFVLIANFRALAGSEGDVAAYDAILAAVAPGQTTVALGDMVVPVETVRLWRNRLAGLRAPRSASGSGINPWTGGIVYYTFDANVSAEHRVATLDAMGEWATFANLTFTERVAQANYIRIIDDPSLFGGQSAVGMAGGEQLLRIGSTTWNRPTLVHEFGHALGLIHEHQRSDRNSFVTINFGNVPGGTGDGNFVLIPTSTNNGAYDFLSIMHYSRKTFAVNPTIDTIVPLPAFAQFIDKMGGVEDRVLSRGDRTGIALMYPPAPVLTTVVTNTKDSGPGSLRAAIYKALDLATDTPGATPTITFQIPNTDPNFLGGVFIIRPSDRLPAPGPGTTIDATTQTAFTGNTNATGPEVLLGGDLQVGPDTYGVGLRLSEANVAVKGLIINAFSTQGILITGPGATGNTVSGCSIGTDATGFGEVPNAFAGIEINGGATGNRIGGTTSAARNLISGNGSQGVAIRGAGTNGNTVEGNWIGLTSAGTAALANHFSGVQIFDGAKGNTIGGTTVGARNVISGNTNQGVAMSDAGTSGNVVAGNFVGLNAAGTAAIANLFAGVEIFAGAANNIIGGIAPGAGNVISGNSAQGAAINGAGSSGNVIAGNFIGTNPAGTASIPNAFSGVGIFNGATANTVGVGNVISGNTSQGIYIADPGTMNNTVAGNFIGLDAAGTAALKNGFAGVEIGSGAQNNTVGGTTAPARNIISGNQNQGIALTGASTSGNRVSGNFIGTNAAGAAAIANGFPGIEIYSSATANTVGGTAPGAGNVISGNASRGITIAGANANTVAGNFIGLNAAGTAALPNAGPGIVFFGGAQNNTVGGTSAGRNFIAGNNGAGITISGDLTNGNTVVGNTIGSAPGGSAVPNTNEGIALFADGSGAPQGNIIGGTAPGAANLISGNTGAGIAIYNPGTTGNRISGNSITVNGGLGIDIWGDGVTSNDSGDSDIGPNNLQNFPVLNSAVLGIGTTISWTLNSTPNATFRVEFFANSTTDGEGRNFIGAVNVSTAGTGNPAVTPISTTLPAIVPAGQTITATAADSAGNTSEFSLHRIVTTTDTDGDGLPNAYETTNSLSTSVADASIDSDGDGMTNAQEFRAGTDPRDSTSVLRLAPPATVSADKTLALTNFAGRTYRIDFADTLAAPTSWRTLADQIPGTGTSIVITDPGAASLPQRFYRAVVLP